jgi:hypothetical protein
VKPMANNFFLHPISLKIPVQISLLHWTLIISQSLSYMPTDD